MRFKADIRRLFQVDASNDKSGNLPAMPGIYPDYPAPIVRNGNGRRELAMARWGMPSSQKASARAGPSGISTAISQNFSQ
jgi:putative SOS response-associated peptidase YedK